MKAAKLLISVGLFAGSLVASTVVAASAVNAPSPGEIEQLQIYVQQNPDAVKETYKLGALYFLSKRFEEASDTWRKILANRNVPLSGSAKVKVAKGMALANYKLGKIPLSYKYIKYVYRQLPEDTKVKRAYDIIKRAYDALFLKPGSTQEIITVIKPVATPVPKPKVSKIVASRAFESGQQYYTEGKIALEQAQTNYEDKFSQAIKEMETAVMGDYNPPKAYYFLGSAHLYRGDDRSDYVHKAQEYLEKSLKLDTDANTYFDLAQVYGLLGDQNKEIEYYEKALELKSRWAECHFRLALAYDKSQRPDAPRKTFENAKAAIREKAEYKKKFQEVLKNSDVAKKIAGIVSEIIEKSENDQLTDAETEKYAKKFQDMLGEKNITAETLKDKDKVRELLNSDRARDIIPGDQIDRIKRGLDDPKQQNRYQKTLNRFLGKAGQGGGGGGEAGGGGGETGGGGEAGGGGGQSKKSGVRRPD
jgi:tetratricopeptide (TPR) repeat protein